MLNKTTLDNKRIVYIHCISWSALFAGSIAGVGLNFLLNLLSLTLGLSSFTLNTVGITSFSWMGFIFFALFAILAMFSSGLIAGILTPKIVQKKSWGLLVGFLSWSLLLIFTILLITNMIQYAAFHSNFTSNLVEIKLRNDSPMLTGTVAHSLANSPLSFNIETHKKVITINALLTFILFFIGAIASSLGGLIGYSKKPKLNEGDL